MQIYRFYFKQHLTLQDILIFWVLFMVLILVSETGSNFRHNTFL
jgi:hypothetical protein